MSCNKINYIGLQFLSDRRDGVTSRHPARCACWQEKRYRVVLKKEDEAGRAWWFWINRKKQMLAKKNPLYYTI